jgi:orotidine-5'-phosphate decarboxylase
VTEAAKRPLFGDRVAQAVTARESQLVLGLDPDPAHLWPRAIELAEGSGGASAVPRERAAHSVAAHCSLAVEAVGEQCVAVKLQVACFERLGAPGWQALYEVSERAREHGLLVIADAKRGDIDVTANAYAQAFLGAINTPYGTVDGLGADALTANPLLGRDSLEPLVACARERGKGVFMLVRTSNPGAADVQDLVLDDGESVSDRLAKMVTQIGRAGVGAHRLSDVGAVVGATAPERIASLREQMPDAILLIPGVGAQGGRVEDLGAAFGSGPASALISASRGIVSAHERDGGDPADTANREAARLREALWSLAGQALA